MCSSGGFAFSVVSSLAVFDLHIPKVIKVFSLDLVLYFYRKTVNLSSIGSQGEDSTLSLSFI